MISQKGNQLCEKTSLMFQTAAIKKIVYLGPYSYFTQAISSWLTLQCFSWHGSHAFTPPVTVYLSVAAILHSGCTNTSGSKWALCY